MKGSKQGKPRKQTSEETVILKAIEDANELLQREDTSQRQTWQLGKRMKQLLEKHPQMPKQQQMDAYFIWGTALARLASQNEDVVLAQAASDKFQQIAHMTNDNEEELGEAIGPIGMSLWGSCLLILATEKQDATYLSEALERFEKAVEMDASNGFETCFQYAKALKEGGDLLGFLKNEQDPRELYARALSKCEFLENLYEKQETSGQETSSRNGVVQEDTEDDEEEEGEEDDRMTSEDLSEVKLLKALLFSVLEKPSAATLALFEEASELHSENLDALLEMTQFVARQVTTDQSQTKQVDQKKPQWPMILKQLQIRHEKILQELDFDMPRCKQIVEAAVAAQRRAQEGDDGDEQEDLHLEDQGVDERVPTLLDSMGRVLYARLRVSSSAPRKDESVAESKKKKRKLHAHADSMQLFEKAQQVLHCAHHLHDQLGCYLLAACYALEGFRNEQECRTWLETGASYGVLAKSLNAKDFGEFSSRSWFAACLKTDAEADIPTEDFAQQQEQMVSDSE